MNMRKGFYKKLALVWGGQESGDPMVIIPMSEVTQAEYDKWTAEFGKPKGRTELFCNLLEVQGLV
jgi:hypothetical protein